MTGKIFIGGLSWNTSETNLKNYFERYGKVADVALMFDKKTGQPRGFAFVTLEDASMVDRIVADEHTIDGRLVDVKAAVSKDKAPGRSR